MWWKDQIIGFSYFEFKRPDQKNTKNTFVQFFPTLDGRQKLYSELFTSYSPEPVSNVIE